MTITLTAHDRTEFARCAQAMYANGCNRYGHALSAASACNNIDLAKFDQLKRVYRTWLCFNKYPKGE